MICPLCKGRLTYKVARHSYICLVCGVMFGDVGRLRKILMDKKKITTKDLINAYSQER